MAAEVPAAAAGAVREVPEALAAPDADQAVPTAEDMGTDLPCSTADVAVGDLPLLTDTVVCCPF